MISEKIKLQKYVWLFLWKVCKITGTGTYFALIAKLNITVKILNKIQSYCLNLYVSD